ncbi:succinate dehydrogenase cytochrome b subunit [Cryomyces antarcticus]|uniref:Cytochrome b subunit of succinate dehydrogenase, Sdh3p n=1 Tax=Cryomyces antarcticus TaxID=329879 RepID=A0ABR0LQQ1_9PEZI|nr:cytochrome b subunit of succinate dehydrogenase, Sdh3p [Cryomyces antarcticus]
MFTQRAVQQSMRRLAVSHPSAALTRFATPAAVATNSHYMQTRQAATQMTSQSDGINMLAQQRTHRPVSPHLGIYRPQVTWYLSALNRITGSILSGGFYVFGAAYLVAPVLGWHLDTMSMAAAFGSWPVFAKVLAKLTLAFPFTFHGFNGIRHLAWDMGRAMTNRQVQVTGWAVVGLSVVSSALLAFFL